MKKLKICMQACFVFLLGAGIYFFPGCSFEPDMQLYGGEQAHPESQNYFRGIPLSELLPADYMAFPLGASRVDGNDVLRVGFSVSDPALSRSLSAKIDLTAAMPPVGFQGELESCNGWAVAYAAKTYFERIEAGGGDVSYQGHQFSPSWIFNQLNGGRNVPTSIVDALDLIVNRGCDTLNGFPYSLTDYTTLPDLKSYSRASRYQGGSWKFVKDVNRIKELLSAGKVVIFCTPVFDSFYNISPSNPIYDPAADRIVSLKAYHSMVIVGYDDSRNAFKFMNSWGKYWGTWRDDNNTGLGKGFGWIAYRTVQHEDFWAFDYTDGRNLSVPYAILKFRPWEGYANQAGRWIAADFDGDSKRDLLHIVDGDYVHTWFARGDGHYRVTSFRPWPGYTNLAGPFLTGDFNGDGRQDVAHVIMNANYVLTWFSNGDGSYAVGVHAAWQGYDNSSGSWLAADLNGDGKTDLVHLVDSDYICPWFSLGNGTYAIGFFRPWNGYAIQSGRWLAADMNGDNIDDLVHLVNSDYVCTWFSAGNGNFWVTAFRPWVGYAVSNGNWMTGDFNGDGKKDLVHLVNSDYILTWFSAGNGNYAVTGFKPWAGYAVSAGQFLVGDFNRDGSDDLVHAVQGSYFCHMWFSQGNGNFTLERAHSGDPAWTPYKTSYGMKGGRWLSGDMDGNKFTDLVHVVDGDYILTWLFNY